MAQRVCPNCGHIENEYTYFCTECGAKTELSQGASSIKPVIPQSVNNIPKPEPVAPITHVEDQREKEISKQEEVKRPDSIQETSPSRVVEENIGIEQEEIAYYSSERSTSKESETTVPPIKNQRNLIIALSAVVGVLLIIIICFAVSSGRNKSDYSAATTHTDEVANTAVDTTEDYYESNDSYPEEQNDNSYSYETEDNIQDQEDRIDENLEAEEQIDDDGIHSYELVVADCSWSEAFNNCIRRGGYLARITTEEEFEAILRQIYSEDKEKIKFWISGACEDGRHYYWVYPDGSLSDESVNDNEKYNGYWLDGEPSFYDDQTESYEDKMNMFYVKSQDRWIWNDVPDDVLSVAEFYSGSMGYICEYE